MFAEEITEGISAIICTYNGSETIEETLQALQAQTGLEGLSAEVILVDNGSTDDTAERAARSWSHASIPLRIIREERVGLCCARRAGFEAARYRLICCVDDDNFLCPDYLSRGFHLMREYPEAAVCGGFGVARFPVAPPAWFQPEWDAFALGYRGDSDGVMADEHQFVHGAGLILRREALIELMEIGCPFLLAGREGSKLTAGEDAELCSALRMLGWQIIQSKQLVFQHYLTPRRLDWGYCEKLFYGFGQAEVLVALYGFYLRPDTFRHRVKKILIRRDLPRRLRRTRREAARAAARLGDGGEGDLALLRLRSREGHRDEAFRLLETGEIWECLAKIREFYHRSRPLRRKREAARRWRN